MVYNSGLTSITGSVNVTSTTSLPQPSATQVPVCQYNVCNGASQNAYTVPAGKTFYYFGGFTTPAVGGTVTVYLNDASTVVHSTNCILNTSQNMVSPVPIAIYTATQIVKVTGTNGLGISLIGYYV